MIWLLCVLSSFLVHSYKSSKTEGIATSGFVWVLAIVFRLTAKTLAFLNAILLFLTAILQFSNITDNCYCNSSKLGRHKNPYTVITFTSDFLHDIKIAWAGGLIMSLLTAALFLIAINLLRKRSTDKALSSSDDLELTELNETLKSRRRTVT